MIAGRGRMVAQQGGGMVIDYKDVLDQAVLNERRRILFNLRRRVENIDTTKPVSGSSYREDHRNAVDFRKDVLRAIIDEENAK